MGKRFITITDKFGKRKKVRTEEEKARRKAETEAKKVFKEKICVWCKTTYKPFHQFGTKQWESSKYCSKECKNSTHNSDPEYKRRKNESRRGNKELHRKEYLQKIEKMGGTLWQVGTEEDRERVRERNRKRYKLLYGGDNDYTRERRANSSFQGVRRKKDKKVDSLSQDEKNKCKEIRIRAKELQDKLDIELHVDHLYPLQKGGNEHPDNLLIMRKEANLFWGSRIKKCPWPRKKNWNEPNWEL